MHLTFDEYASFGYVAVSAPEFRRYEAMARKTVDKFCFNRVTAENATDDNKLGMAEMIDFYKSANTVAVGEAGVPIKSFSNEGYSESYHTPISMQGDTGASVDEQAWRLGEKFFSAEQKYRGV